MFNALYRRQAELEAERLHQFERVITEVAAKFVDIAPEAVDEEIDTALQRICEFADADLVSLLEWDGPEQSTLRVSHKWGAESIDRSYFGGEILARESPWLVSQLRVAEPLVISDLDDFPAAATAERTMCERAGIQSIVWIPFLAATGIESFIVLATVNRPGLSLDSLTPQITMAGNIFTSAIKRQRTDLELRHANDEIRNLNDRIKAENVALRDEVIASGADELVGMSLVFRHILHQAELVGPTDSTVLLLGETGTGKGLIARRIHDYSQRKNNQLITVNCAALPGSLIESELFGHEKGAFTGAVSRKIGRFELADGGTIFLDEIGDLPVELQSKLLRVLQEREFERLGSSTTRTVDARVIAATNRDLDALIEEGTFRADLYYRLGVFPIRIPSLSERRDDIPLLVWYFISKLQSRLGKRFKTVPRLAMDALISYAWPGNVRELQNIVERSMILSPGGTLDLDSSFLETRGSTPTATETSARQSLNLEEVERTHILSVLVACDWKVRGKGGAAEHLGLNRSTLQSRMKKLGIHRPTV
jgi:transcriptional regulator with GAF, ATPase, and Fis domain